MSSPQHSAHVLYATNSAGNPTGQPRGIAPSHAWLPTGEQPTMGIGPMWT
ncbi:MAG TPA: hypothetical protein VKY19_03790 [Ktedonosporobacter sp.]|nr:hypothetical protein [Ktedonosporobacter sp.]